MYGSRPLRKEFLGICFLALCLYLPFLSSNYDLNGVTEAEAVEAGDLSASNHFLYRPIGFLAYHFLRELGYRGRSLPVLQILTAVCGALGVGFAYLAFQRLSQNRIAALAASLWWGTSWAYWYFSADASYIVPAAMLVAAALALAVELHSISSAVAAGTLLAAAILTWQAIVFLVPVFAIQGVFAAKDEKDGWRSRLAPTGVLLGTCIIIVGLFYCVLGFVVYHHHSLAELLRWAGSHAGGTLPMWGNLREERLWPAATSFVESLLPLRPRLVAGEFVGVSPEPLGFPFWSAVVAELVLAGLLVVGGIFSRGKIFTGRNSVIWILSSYVFFLPFLLWWDPYEAKWLVIPNLFLAALIAVLTRRSENRVGRGLLIACVLAIAIANFSTTIWPRHHVPGRAIQLASCVSDNMSEADLFLATDWGWVGYLRYLHGRHAISLIELAAYFHDKEPTVQEVRRRVLETQRRGGKVYIIDLSSYKPEHLGWFRAQTGFTEDDLYQAESSPSFVCGGTRFRVLAPMQP